MQSFDECCKIKVNCTQTNSSQFYIKISYRQKAKTSCGRTGCCFSWQRCKQSDRAAKTDLNKFPKTFFKGSDIYTEVQPTAKLK